MQVIEKVKDILTRWRRQSGNGAQFQDSPAELDIAPGRPSGQGAPLVCAVPITGADGEASLIRNDCRGNLGMLESAEAIQAQWSSNGMQSRHNPTQKSTVPASLKRGGSEKRMNRSNPAAPPVDGDVARALKNSESVNQALRLLLDLS
jgi:hypothetical protein